MNTHLVDFLIISLAIFLTCLSLGGFLLLASRLHNYAWRIAAHRWRDEAKKLNRYNHDLSEQLWDNEQQITRLVAEKNVAVEMLSPIVLENESLRNKLREVGVKS